MSLCALTLCCGAKIVRAIRVESWEVFLNISGTVWSTATKPCMQIDIMEWEVLVVKNLWHCAQVWRGKGIKFMASYYVFIQSISFSLCMWLLKGRRNCVKIWLQNSKWLWRKLRLYFAFGHILYLKYGISKWNQKCRALPVVNNFVAWEEQIIMLKTGSKSIQKWRKYIWLKFGTLRKRLWEVCWLTAWQLVKPDMRSRDWRAINK